ncbi:MAG: glycosyltransferase [Nitrospirae bacterium]|nr:glycosyltransferase [Nitrospirota bacterium]
MHQSSFSIVTRFRELVEKHFSQRPIQLLDVGSYGVNGTYKEIFADTAKFLYTGLDVNPGPNVDYVPADPYSWPELKDETFDVIISGQAFEHIEFPWLVIEEMKRTLKKNGLICIVAPSRGPEHKYPVDCWRYYPDGFRALAKWAGLEVLESKTFWGTSGFSDGSDQWGDSFCILYKPNDVHGAVKHKRAERKSFAAAHQNNPLKSAKKSSYFGFARNEVVEALVKNRIPAGKVLEIGCAGGATGKSLKEKMAIDSYVGIELSEEAAGIARQHLDKVIVADIERTDLQKDHGLKHSDFDLLVVLDVLEHLYDPWDVLKELTDFIKPGGHIVVSLPNVQNITVVQDLIRGKWQYEDAGILDATHLRFFTLEESMKLITGAGLTIRSIDKVLNPPLDMSQVKDSGNRFKQGNLEISDLSKDEITNLFTYQFIVIAQKEVVPTDVSSEGKQAGAIAAQQISDSFQAHFQHRETIKGLTSIVILTFNQLEYTKKCLKSIRKHTPEPHEIIFVDNGSTDGTVKWLGRLVKENKKYVLIQNETNLGFAKGCNQGIEASKGEYILLLNNDVIVAKDWLSGLIECLTSAPDTGIVGPMTNNISGPQQVTSSDYRSADHLDEYAAQFRQKNRYRRIPLRRIVGFCMLFRRSLAGNIGLLDESFGSGNFEDDDYCLRAALEGNRNLIAGDVFIHHFGSISFKGNKIPYASSMGSNKKIFDRKWRNIPARSEPGKRLAVLNAVEQADELYQKQLIDQAIAALIEGIKYYPDANQIYYRLAEILIDSRLFNDALEALGAMADNEPKRLALIGYCREGLDELDEADSYADKALSLDGGFAPALNLKGIVAYKQGSREAAEAFFLRAIDSDAGYGEPYSNLGVIKWTAGEQIAALDLLEKGFLFAPMATDISALYHSAIISTAEFRRGEDIIRGIAVFYPLLRGIILLLIDILLHQNKKEQALYELQKAMVTFGIDDNLLSAALEVRKEIGPKGIDASDKDGTLSVCMIVKNEERHLARCLMSVLAVADEIIIVDTGSTDRTREIARAFGARVTEFPWTGDFSEARNASLELASGAWIFVLDGDETISAQDYERLRSITRNKTSKSVAFNIVTRNYVRSFSLLGWNANKGEYPLEEIGTGWFPSGKTRLFSNDRSVRFSGHVHELVEQSIIAAGIEIRQCDIVVHHFGKLDSSKAISKGESYYLLGMRKLEENPNDIKSLFELANQAQELEKYQEAMELWQRAIDLSKDKPSAIFFFNISSCHLRSKQYEEALHAAKKAVLLDPCMKEASLNYSYAELLVGDYAKVITELVAVLKETPDYPPAMVLLAAAYSMAGKKQGALDILSLLAGKGLKFEKFLHDLCEQLVELGRTSQAIPILESLIERGAGNDDTTTLLDVCRKG